MGTLTSVTLSILDSMRNVTSASVEQGREDMDPDEPSKIVGGRSNVASSRLPPTLAAIPRRRAGSVGGRGATAAS